ncbi:NADH dehydrogenase [Anaerobacterium chartisolvens]|uniref:NADH:ubiquinone reductase (non-electrogenic) n=1 Tax=Anaerobacterium chartisolvens TaxID=1297424 RepID=A0A369APX2_9FIRM|nr:FAD-dependent oxidoreductase [Anaerobacterium chartisolvens]RCX11165.1 NADH dehydrogenase [Anaerobacterium chartisolvens]
MHRRIAVLGAGYAGIEAALSLYKKKRRDSDIEITVIDRNPYHTLLTELHEVAGNRISEDGVIVPLRDIFKYTDIKHIRDDITDIDFNSNSLVSSVNKYTYDYLIIAAGSEPNYYGIQGMREHSFSLWSFEDAVRIREHIKDCFLNASEEKNPDTRKSLLTFIVGGGGFTGVEMIGELAQWVKLLCIEHSIDRSEVRLVLVEALPAILSNLNEKSIKKTMRYLKQKLGVEVLTDSAITSVEFDRAELKGGTVISSRTIIWTAGVRAACITDEISIDKGRACRIKVNEYTGTQFENVYAVGDISAFVFEGQTMPALVESALQTGKTAARNILADIEGKEKTALRPRLHGVMVSVGSFFAVADIMGYQLPVFFSILMKYAVNIHYLFGIGGFELVFKYLKHELLHKRHKRLLLEKHLTFPTRAFWLVPVRLFLGYSWLYEGISKVNEGWLAKAMLVGSGTDGNTSASVSETGEKIFTIVSGHTPAWYSWIADNIVVPNALLFQVLIVMSEIGIGLAFFTGTFTFIAALASIGLNINFILSTGLYPETWWYIPAALSMLGGAGRAFGLDHYLMPYLMRQWRFFARNKRLKFRI